MDNKSELEKTVEFALKGAPEIKGEEKRKWLGEFRERIVYGVSIEAALQMESICYIEKAMEDQEAEMLIVNNRLPTVIINNYMKLAKKLNREYRAVETDYHGAMGVVVASRSAINRDIVEETVKMLPSKYKGLRNKHLCGECYSEIEANYAEYEEFFDKISFGDKMIGIKCGACENDRVDAIMM